ncbi:MAG: hypothetical protein Q8Q06_03750 [bacterium]|nr:hypothetical protein [bacterium]
MPVQEETKDHNVAIDRVGLFNLTRLTCYTCEKTLVAQPHMSVSEWDWAKSNFFTEHPCKNPKDEGFRG